jgi:hypothetical protein
MEMGVVEERYSAGWLYGHSFLALSKGLAKPCRDVRVTVETRRARG